jgi:hypothetical protein
MSEITTLSWADLSTVQKKQQIVETSESYTEGLQQLTGRDVRLSLSFGHHPDCADGVAVFTIEVEL